ncbi:MAG: MMPL family transporter, partial [Planctomycetaceae bacterium]
ELASTPSICCTSSPLPPGYRTRLAGLPVLRVEIVNDLRADQWTLIPLAAITYLAVLWFMFRSVSGSLLPMVAVGIALAWTFAVFAATGESLNLVSNVLPVLLLIIGVSSSVQLVSCYSEEMQECGGDRLVAAQRAIAHMTPACLLAALTTAIGFASVATARSLVLKRFAWQAALGVGFQYLCTLLTLGTLFRFFAHRDATRPWWDAQGRSPAWRRHWGRRWPGTPGRRSAGRWWWWRSRCGGRARSESTVTTRWKPFSPIIPPSRP